MKQTMLRENCTREVAYQKTTKSGPAEFTRRLKDIVQNLNHSNHKSNHIVFIDKNHPKDAVEKAISEIESNLPKNIQAKYFYLVP